MWNYWPAGGITTRMNLRIWMLRNISFFQDTFKMSAWPWKNDKDSHISLFSTSRFEKIIISDPSRTFCSKSQILHLFNHVENLRYKKERVGLPWFCSFHLYTWSQRGLFPKSTKGKVTFTWVLFTLEVNGTSSEGEILLIPNSTVGISIMDFHEQKCLCPVAVLAALTDRFDCMPESFSKGHMICQSWYFCK